MLEQDWVIDDRQQRIGGRRWQEVVKSGSIREGKKP